MMQGWCHSSQAAATAAPWSAAARSEDKGRQQLFLNHLQQGCLTGLRVLCCLAPTSPFLCHPLTAPPPLVPLQVPSSLTRLWPLPRCCHTRQSPTRFYLWAQQITCGRSHTCLGLLVTLRTTCLGSQDCTATLTQGIHHAFTLDTPSSFEPAPCLFKTCSNLEFLLLHPPPCDTGPVVIMERR